MEVLFAVAIIACCVIIVVYSVAYIWGKISSYIQFRKRALTHSHQRMNYGIFSSTYRLFPDRYEHYRQDGELCWVKYKIDKKVYPYYTDTERHYLLFGFFDWYMVDRLLLNEKKNREKKEVEGRETNDVLDDLQRLCKQEIEKAEKEVSDAMADMKNKMNQDD